MRYAKWGDTMCRNTEKMRFSTMRSALQAVVEQFETHGRSQEVYVCSDHFHLTTSETEHSPEVLDRIKEAAR